MLDIDAVKHSLGRWDSDPAAAGRQARRLALALIRQHVADGHDVYLGQFLARPEFISQLEDLARVAAAQFVEFVLIVDPATLRSRVEYRAAHPQRASDQINASQVSADDVPALVQSMNALLSQRPNAIPVDASGTLEETVVALRHHLTRPSRTAVDPSG